MPEFPTNEACRAAWEPLGASMIRILRRPGHRAEARFPSKAGVAHGQRGGGEGFPVPLGL